MAPPLPRRPYAIARDPEIAGVHAPAIRPALEGADERREATGDEVIEIWHRPNKPTLAPVRIQLEHDVTPEHLGLALQRFEGKSPASHKTLSTAE